MRYLSVAEIANKWDVSERSVRNYCAQGRVNERCVSYRQDMEHSGKRRKTGAYQQKKRRADYFFGYSERAE